MLEEEKLNRKAKKEKGEENGSVSSRAPAENGEIHPSRRGRVAGGSYDT